MSESRFHCCATCTHFQTNKTQQGMTYFCSRLRYETKPDYRFNCWEPKEHIVKLIKKEQGK
ncbi:hypothetical protein L2716_05895 [Alkalihalobacillus berkeleyi]|uniref:Uncharacterized protein n=1 Tax=Pseudalkalibacillus berkeleyi TaxID=1069813 RepID=A0ABS9H0H9_9BACL|nr:hypothetical protein [Pseudalkalibacillus berkeleyi]